MIRRALATALLALVAPLLIGPAPAAEALTCTSQYIQPNKGILYTDDEMGTYANLRVFERVWSYACGSRDKFTDFEVGYTGFCNPDRIAAVIVNPSPIAGRNVGEIRLPCRRTGGASVVYSLYGKTYAAGVGDRCARVTGRLDVIRWFDRDFATASRCQS